MRFSIPMDKFRPLVYSEQKFHVKRLFRTVHIDNNVVLRSLALCHTLFNAIISKTLAKTRLEALPVCKIKQS